MFNSRSNSYCIDFAVTQGTWQFMSAHLVKNIHAIHGVEDDLESSLYVVLWTALMFKESYMSSVDRTQFIMQVFDADPLVGSGGSAKSNWLVARTDFLRDLFVDCKPLDDVVLELTQFFAHRYSVVPPEAQETLVQLQLSLAEIMDGVGPAPTAVQRKIMNAAQNILLESVAYQKEMGMKKLQSHEAVIDIYNKHLESPGWPDQDAAVLRKLHPIDKPNRRRMYTKSLCASQVVTGQLTPASKKRRLDLEGNAETLSNLGLDDLASLNQ